MPIYQYECRVCHLRFERKGKFNEEAVTACPQCQGEAHRIFTPPEIMVKDKWKSRD